jgi:hypothetical protein
MRDKQQKSIKERFKGRLVAIVMDDNPERLEGILFDSPLFGDDYIALRRNVDGRPIMSILNMDYIKTFQVVK